MSKKVRCYHATREVIDIVKKEKHTILVYGELVQTNEAKGFLLAPVTYNKINHREIRSIDDRYVVLSRNQDRRPTRQFNFGWAICDANDEFDLATGIKIAKRRFSDSPMTTTDVRFFSDDMIRSILESELNFIERHLEIKYLPDDFKVEVDDSKVEVDDCESNCETHDVSSLGEKPDDSLEIEVEVDGQDAKTEELPTVEFEAHKEQHTLKHGDFVKFTNGYSFMYGVVRDNGLGIDSKSPYVNLYWKLIKTNDGWVFRTNETIDTREIEFLTPREYEDDLTYKILYEVFGVIWDRKRKSIKLKSF
jgi:hypothetical protein